MTDEELQTKFDNVVKEVGGMSGPYVKKMSNDQKLHFYGLFKVINDGKAHGKTPSKLTNLVGHYKMKAWKAKSRYSKREALIQFIKRATEMDPEKMAKL